VKLCLDAGCTMTTYLPAPQPSPVNWPKLFMYAACLAGAPPELMAVASGSPQEFPRFGSRNARSHELLGLWPWKAERGATTAESFKQS
jgi:hypothetical protein